MLVKTVVLFACVAVASAALSFSPLAPKPEKFKDIEGCYIEEHQVVIGFGKTLSSKQRCLQYRCATDYLREETCGVYFLDENKEKTCHLVEDREKPYPDCCPTLQCNDEA